MNIHKGCLNHPNYINIICLGCQLESHKGVIITEIIEKIEKMKAVAARDVQDQEYEDNYVYNRNSIIDEIIDRLKGEIS